MCLYNIFAYMIYHHLSEFECLLPIDAKLFILKSYYISHQLFTWLYFIHIHHDCFTALGQSYDCPSASEATMKNMGKTYLYLTTTKCSNCMHIDKLTVYYMHCILYPHDISSIHNSLYIICIIYYIHMVYLAHSFQYNVSWLYQLINVGCVHSAVADGMLVCLIYICELNAL